MPWAVITWLTAWLLPQLGAWAFRMERSSFCWERRSGISGSTAGAHRRPHLFPHTLLQLCGKDERKVSDAQNWWRCADRDGLSRLSLSPDHYPAGAALTAGRNATFQFFSRNTGLVYTGAGIYFVVALALGAWFLFGPARGKREMDAACPTCAPVTSETHAQERSPMPDDLPATRREALR
jgi:hypothetical protein